MRSPKGMEEKMGEVSSFTMAEAPPTPAGLLLWVEVSTRGILVLGSVKSSAWCLFNVGVVTPFSALWMRDDDDAATAATGLPSLPGLTPVPRIARPGGPIIDAWVINSLPTLGPRSCERVCNSSCSSSSSWRRNLSNSRFFLNRARRLCRNVSSWYSVSSSQSLRSGSSASSLLLGDFWLSSSSIRPR